MHTCIQQCNTTLLFQQSKGQLTTLLFTPTVGPEKGFLPPDRLSCRLTQAKPPSSISQLCFVSQSVTYPLSRYISLKVLDLPGKCQKDLLLTHNNVKNLYLHYKPFCMQKINSGVGREVQGQQLRFYSIDSTHFPPSKNVINQMITFGRNNVFWIPFFFLFFFFLKSLSYT